MGINREIRGSLRTISGEPLNSCAIVSEISASKCERSAEKSRESSMAVQSYQLLFAADSKSSLIAVKAWDSQYPAWLLPSGAIRVLGSLAPSRLMMRVRRLVPERCMPRTSIHVRFALTCPRPHSPMRSNPDFRIALSLARRNSAV